jgi:hypothetical protein
MKVKRIVFICRKTGYMEDENEIGKGALSGAATGAATGSMFGPWGTAIGGVVGLGAGLFGGAKVAQKRKRMEQYLRQQSAENQAWYNTNALSDYMQRADSQALLKHVRDNLYRQNRAAANTAVVTGATPEQQAVQKELSNKALSDTYSRLGAIGQQWKDNVTDKYLARKDMIGSGQMGMWNNQATGYENLMNNGFQTAGNSFLQNI